MKGFTDKPTSTLNDDSFGVKQYIAGLNDYILECNTPMTIAIQGDWGSGKTSMMNMIKDQLGDRVITTWFNTWQYSQFNMGDELAVSFLSRLISELEMEQEQKNGKREKVIKILSLLAKKTAVIAVETLISGKLADGVEQGLNATEQEMDLPQAISKLKEEFQAAVNDRIEQAKKKHHGIDRLVIFIDDLDRLHPGKAVELLEVLKLFLDCDKCVFVLAIDYAVVSQGVKQKYGELIGEEKGKSFFDKIIQVPFKMPVAQYNVKDYVAESLKAFGLPISDSEKESYVKLIQKSVGCNPRAMKRLFNAFLLLNKIADKGEVVIEPAQRKMLFAILCLQLSFESIYNYIVQNAEDCYDGGLLQDLTTSDKYKEGSEAEWLSHELHLNTDTDIMNAVEFMTVFKSVLDQDGDGELAKEEVESFINILRFSTITANTSTVANADVNWESYYRYYNRDIIKDVLFAIQGNYDKPFKLYQTRTNNNPDWKMYYVGAKKTISTAFGGEVILVFKLATDVQTHESTLSIYIHAGDRTDRHKFVERMQEWYSNQKYGFTYLEESCEFRLNNNPIPADKEHRQEIIQYFTEKLPLISDEVKKVLKA